jgi:hypothetical protein
VDRLSLLNPVRLGTLVAQEGQGEVDALVLAEPAFGLSVPAPRGAARRAVLKRLTLCDDDRATLRVRQHALKPGESPCWLGAGSAPAPRHLPAQTGRRSTIFTIFEGTSEIQRLIIGRAVTGLDVR